MDSIENIDEFVAQWIAFHTTYTIEGEIAYSEAIWDGEHGGGILRTPFQPKHRMHQDPATRDKLIRLSGTTPKLAWELILRIIAATVDPAILSNLKIAFDLLLTRNGSEFIPLIEERAQTDSNFRSTIVLLRSHLSILRGEGSPEIYERIMAV